MSDEETTTPARRGRKPSVLGKLGAAYERAALKQQKAQAAYDKLLPKLEPVERRLNEANEELKLAKEEFDAALEGFGPGRED